MADTHIGVSLHPIASRLVNKAPKPHIGPDIDAYRSVYAQSVGSTSDAWWADIARESLHWDRPFTTVRSGSFVQGNIVWFPEGGLNAAYNCVDRWAFKDPSKVSFHSPPSFLAHTANRLPLFTRLMSPVKAASSPMANF